ncbi:MULTISPECIES: hypothetical protein [Streptomyces]|uniref:hypothetical protein n=1 Tax=Streptomyces TaxID=1883 RepID=UPI0006AFE13C|nr:hypothetical protein [Streptomyces sp. WM6349]KOU14939.1 hypothetical protein ADK49_21845 [Streptomyces sp. WM6349]KOU97750.1 hypothetical protein ADK91_32015 [Streptomyces sp. XY511]KOV41280.1 hypothetical protein ADK98_26845 [Streptomyces sp. H036]GLV96051.1 hypothetical protein Slala04_75040 [Streptomyces lavendulae subsp. lavendulae]
MSTSTAPGTINGLCEHIRGALAEWAPGMLGVHVPRSVSGPAEVARLVDVVAAAAEVTVLPGDGATARAEMNVAAARAAAGNRLPRYRDPCRGPVPV